LLWEQIQANLSHLHKQLLMRYVLIFAHDIRVLFQVVLRFLYCLLHIQCTVNPLLNPLFQTCLRGWGLLYGGVLIERGGVGGQVKNPVNWRELPSQ
jgi:hypothetical protein